MDLNAAADRLYGLPPDDFTAARDALAKEIKAAGDGRLARDIGKLRRPTVVAWAINQASRRHLEELGELLDLGERLRAAWYAQDAAALSELTGRRSELTGRLSRLIAGDAEREGRRLTALPEVEQTLDAAIVDADAAERVRSGHLVTALSYSGFAPAPTPRPSRTGTGERPGARRGGRAREREREPERRAAGGRAEDRRDTERERERRDRERRERERRAERLRRAADDAGRAAAEAERSHAEWAAELETAVRERDRLAAEVAVLRDRLDTAAERLGAAEQRLRVTERDEAAAAKAAAGARDEATRARAALED
ncbi:hypothetical protein IMZ11_10200 [Microtetraspora sp. AC03309]|uniref:hypothetical protein n=1 Tax=Microtetraspora sp. AC03309 TaxID=2779376 RepID=UPI001E5B0089|nr:hypothetical protein [Microtetraspora sp. AC03309]MCC5576010.1 hypothetical protein [Microtetraspora sp. AC03309]